MAEGASQPEINWTKLGKQVNGCMLRHRRSFSNRIKKLRVRAAENKAVDGGLSKLIAEMESSAAELSQRKAGVPQVTYPDELPVSQKRDDIAKAIHEHQVTIIAGETGSGKTTQIPKICLELGRGIAGTIGHTQPRRIAARSVAGRIAEELGSPLGKDIGYKVRFSDHTQNSTYIKLMTDGILLAEIQHDPKLLRYDTIIIDEAHERSLNIDFLLGYLKNILPQRPDLKLIITSATINTERFSEYFDGAPVIEVSGRSYPVDIEYRPLSESEDDDSLQEAIIHAVDDAAVYDPMGDILVFLPGEREIRDAAHALKQHEMKGTEVLPLFSRLSPAEQDRIFKPHSGRRIVLATNVAETSLTVPGIRFVIDTGVARISRYSPKSKVQQLPIEPISKASANQRAGRCGRVAAGICFRLYSEENYNNRPEQTDPEILRTNLAHVILQMLSLGLGDIHAFPFMEAPEKRSIQDGFKLLEELQSIDSDGKLTAIGKQLIRLPVDPRFGRMIIQAHKERSLHEVLIIVAALSVQDPKHRPADAGQKADEKHAVFTDKDSDFLSWLKLWNWYHEQAHHLSKSQLRKTCEKHYLSHMRIREWHDLHGQILGIVRELKMTPNQEPASADEVHRALLAGLLSHIATKVEDAKKHDKSFVGARNLQVTLFPGSSLYKKPPKWIMAASLVATTKLYAREVGPIDPAWLEALTPSLVKRNYSEPHWSKKRAQVNALETVTLYGLPIISQRKAHFGPVDPVISREIFIRHALVHQEIQSFGKWFKHNQKLLDEVEALEAKSRRRDLMSDEQTRYDFFDSIIPEGIYSGKLFEQWRKVAEKKNPEILFLNKSVLLQDDSGAIDAGMFPNTMKMSGLNLKLNYHFDPTLQADGITVQVPIIAVGQLEPNRFEWLVPGLLEEKITALIKGLPKSLRKNFVPAPQFAKACAESLPFGEGSLLLALSRQLEKMTGISVPTKEWNTEQLPQHLQMKFSVIDEKGKIKATDTNLLGLQQEYAHLARASMQQIAAAETQTRQGITRWDFGALPIAISQDKHGMQVRLFPALVDKKSSVSIELFESEQAANEAMFGGVRRLLMLSLHQQVEMLRKNMPNQKELALFYIGIGNNADLLEDLIQKTFETVFLQNSALPRDEQAFQKLLDSGRAKVVKQGGDIAKQTLETLKAYAALNTAIAAVKAAPLKPVVDDIKKQIVELIHPGFVANTPAKWLPHLPRFLQAAEIRLQRAGPNLNQDVQNTQVIHKLRDQYQKECKQRQQHHESVEPLLEYRWLLEELSVSLFAQNLKTTEPVSAKRLEKRWKEITA